MVNNFERIPLGYSVGDKCPKEGKGLSLFLDNSIRKNW